MALAARSVDSGTGIDVLVDDGATGDMQIFKLAAGTVASEELIGSLDHGSVQSLYVHPRPDTVIATTPINSSGLTTASTNYSNGDTLGAGWTVPNAAKASAGTGRVIGVTIIDYADILSMVTLFMFQGSVTFGTDNSAPSLSDADSLKLACEPVTLTLTDLGGVRVAGVGSISIPYVLDGTDLYVYARADSIAASFFGAATDLKLRVSVTRD